jgi:creatinine amidohydrolase/Fe(II)-dependent formamide hydrolase-like protein
MALCTHLAAQLSRRHGVLLADPLSYGDTTAFSAYAGITAIKSKHAAAACADLFSTWAHRGITTFFCITNIPYIEQSLHRAHTRLQRRAARARTAAAPDTAAQHTARTHTHTGTPAITAHMLCWHTHPEARACCDRLAGEAIPHRCELADYADLCMIAHLDPSRLRGQGVAGEAGTGAAGNKASVSPASHEETAGNTSSGDAQYGNGASGDTSGNVPAEKSSEKSRPCAAAPGVLPSPAFDTRAHIKWRKRGKDPDRFRKLYPGGLVASPSRPDADLGAALYRCIFTVFDRCITQHAERPHA